MNVDDFILQAGYGDETAVRAALAEVPALAGARNPSGVSVIATTVYAGNLRLAREIANTRDDLDLFEAASLGDCEQVRTLLEMNAGRINDCAPDGFSPLDLARRLDKMPLVERFSQVEPAATAPDAARERRTR